MQNLLDIARLKAKAHRCYFTEVKEIGERIRFTFYGQAKICLSNVAPFTERYQGALQFVRDAKAPYLEYSKGQVAKKKGAGTLDLVGRILDDVWEMLVEAVKNS